MTRDPSTPAFWDRLFDKAITPWDAQATPHALDTWLEAHREPGRVLIPGCGSAWEALAFERHGWEVTALDFSPRAIDKAGAFLAEKGFRGRLICGDFFTHAAEPYTLIYERAFLASFPRHLWAPWAARLPLLLQPHGRLMGCFFIDETQPLDVSLPPFALRPGELGTLLGEGFTLGHSQRLTGSVAVFADREWWQIWEYLPK